MKYACTYQSGGGAEYNDGEWERKETPKTITLTKIKEFMSGVYAMHRVGEKIKVGKGTGNPIKYEEDDGSFVVYFQQAGTPYSFTPL